MPKLPAATDSLLTKQVRDGTEGLRVLDMARVPARSLALRLPKWLVDQCAGEAEREHQSLALWVAQAMYLRLTR